MILGIVIYSSDSETVWNVFRLGNLSLDKGGQILVCDTCLKLRHTDGTELCPLSTMANLYKLINESDKINQYLN